MPLVTPSNADGTIRIDTKIDEGSANEQFKKISRASAKATKEAAKAQEDMARKSRTRIGTILAGFYGAFRGLKASITNLLSLALKGAALLTLGFLGLILVIQRWGQETFETLQKGIDRTSAYFDLIERGKAAFNQFRGAVLSVFATILTALLPIIIRIVDWISVVLERFNMVLAALLGQKTVLRAIVKEQQNLTKEQKKGALAAFDQLNILQEQQDLVAEPDKNPLTFEEVPISPEALEFADKLKTKFEELKEKALGVVAAITNSEPWKRTKEFLANEWEDLKRGWARTVEFIGHEWEDIKTFIPKTWQFIKDDFALLVEVLNTGWQRTVEFAKQEWEGIVNFFKGIWEFIQADFGNLKEALQDGWQRTVEFVRNEWTGIKDFFSNIWQGIEQTFFTFVHTVDALWESMWNGIKEVAKNTVNIIISFINRMIDAIVGGINAAIDSLNSIQIEIPEWLPVIGGQTLNLSIPRVSVPRIPQLATGAVIPPNARFLAMLGDQRSGTNIETPENLLRQIVREELSGFGGDITLNNTITLDGEVISKNQRRVQARHGTSLIASGTI